MNKTLETIRHSWLTRETETAEADRKILRNSIDQIPADPRGGHFDPAEPLMDGHQRVRTVKEDIGQIFRDRRMDLPIDRLPLAFIERLASSIGRQRIRRASIQRCRRYLGLMDSPQRLCCHGAEGGIA